MSTTKVNLGGRQMSLTDGNGLSAADVAAVTGNNGGFGNWGGDGAW